MSGQINEGKAYVEKLRAKGRSDEEIRQGLRQAGWSDDQIHALFAAEIPRPPSPHVASSWRVPPSPRGRKSNSTLRWIVAVALGVAVAFFALWGMSELMGVGEAGREAKRSADELADSVGYRSEPNAGRQAEERVQRTTARTWQRVASWRGQGIKTTPKFTVGAEWAIEWKTTPGQYGDMLFQIFINGGDGSLAGVAANVIGAGHDTTYQHQAGTYYLEVNSGQSWEIVVSEKR